MSSEIKTIPCIRSHTFVASYSSLKDFLANAQRLGSEDVKNLFTLARAPAEKRMQPPIGTTAISTTIYNCRVNIHHYNRPTWNTVTRLAALNRRM